MSCLDCKRAAILIVNGGADAQAGRWIRLCLHQVYACTDYANYQIYVWNNRSQDQELESWLAAQPNLTLLSAASYETLAHPHRVPLQRLYHLARAEGAFYIITLDTDAFPIRSGWLEELTGAIDAGAAIAGAWRDEMAGSIQPYIHPSCLCTTADFIETFGLRFDYDSVVRSGKSDTLSHFTREAEAAGRSVYPLMRSNRRNFHYLMGGIYGDLVYHHAAASRENFVFFSDKSLTSKPPHLEGLIGLNRQLRDATADLLFEKYDEYMGWLRGLSVSSDVERILESAKTKGHAKNSPSWQIRTSRRFKSHLTKLTNKSWLKYIWKKFGRKPEYSQKIEENFQPFTRKNLAVLPRCWRAGPPDFVGVGAPKCGTTWWYHLMLAHPQVIQSRVIWGSQEKELQYFVNFQYHTMSQEQEEVYRQAFAAPPGAVSGEFSVQYLAYPLSLEQLKRAAPDTRIIVILRNPIDRFISHHNHLINHRQRDLYPNIDWLQTRVFQTFSLYTEAALSSLYSIGLERLARLYAPDKILLLQYEQLVRSPGESLSRTYQFIGVDGRFVPTQIDQPINAASAYVVPKPDLAERQLLAEYFYDDVRRVRSLFPQLDITLWPEFNADSSTGRIKGDGRA